MVNGSRIIKPSGRPARHCWKSLRWLRPAASLTMSLTWRNPRWGSLPTRRAATKPGTGMSLSPCSRMPCVVTLSSAWPGRLGFRVLAAPGPAPPAADAGLQSELPGTSRGAGWTSPGRGPCSPARLVVMSAVIGSPILLPGRGLSVGPSLPAVSENAEHVAAEAESEQAGHNQRAIVLAEDEEAGAVEACADDERRARDRGPDPGGIAAAGGGDNEFERAECE